METVFRDVELEAEYQMEDAKQEQIKIPSLLISSQNPSKQHAE